MRSWTVDPTILAAPQQTTTYLVEVACSSDPSCTGTTAVTRSVACPTSATNLFPTIVAPDDTSFAWSATLDTVHARGNLSTVATLAPGASGSLGAVSSFDISADLPAAGTGFWYLFREDVAGGPECNSAGGWSSGGLGEQPGRDAALP